MADAPGPAIFPGTELKQSGFRMQTINCHRLTLTDDFH